MTAVAVDFVEALVSGDLDAVKAVPKTDVHCHALFSARREAVAGWIGSPLAAPPAKMEGLDGMTAYADAVLMPHIRHRAGFEFVATAAVDAAVREGIVRLEMSFDIRLVTFYPDGLTGLCTFLETLVSESTLHPELGVARESAADPKLMRFVHEALERGVFRSIDLYGREDACPPEAMRPVFRKARRAGMRCKAHVGEFGGAESVRHAVSVLDLDAVQHGIGAAESESVMRWLSECGIPLNVCPTSNVMLGGVSSLAAHPIRVLFDNGVRVTVNTDDLMIFGQSVSEEYLNLYAAQVFSAAELDQIRLASLEA